MGPTLRPNPKRAPTPVLSVSASGGTLDLDLRENLTKQGGSYQPQTRNALLSVLERTAARRRDFCIQNLNFGKINLVLFNEKLS